MKYLSMLLMMVALSVCMVSCGDDEEEEIDQIGNFYVEYEATGGGLTSAQLNSVKSQFSSEYGAYLNGVEKDEAIYRFKELVKQIRDDCSNGITVGGAAISGTLNLRMTLKTEAGKTVKQGTVYITKDGATYEV